MSDTLRWFWPALRSNGRRHLQDAYFEHDNVRNHLTLLRRTGRI